MPRAFSDAEKQTIGERLRAEGRKAFAHYGIRKTRVEELAAATGISKGAFYLFYESKEALFMDVLEEAEREFRQEILATVAQAGPSPQARLYATLHKAFTLWKQIPILRIFTHADYEVLARRVPAETLQVHLYSDHGFATELVAACKTHGIAIVVPPDEVDGLLHALFFTTFHEDDFGPGTLTAPIELLLKLVAAYCLGDVPRASLAQMLLPTHTLLPAADER